MTSDTIELIKIGVITIGILVVAIPVLRMLRLGKIASISAGKDGVKLDMASMNKRSESKHYLDKRIREVDTRLCFEHKKVTMVASKSIMRIFTRDGMCTDTSYVVSHQLNGVLYLALDENDFKNKLAIGNKDEYIASKLEDMRDTYTDIKLMLGKKGCVETGHNLPLMPFEDIEQALREIVTFWADSIKENVIKGCRTKIETYEEYRKVFQEDNDKYFCEVVEKCIAKNKKYIEDLG